ncbi:MAG: molybdenum cofactor biosynthesis protein MoaE [Candidatus Rokubacteria bacterium]|nr:molybdenum cofactor biosynthesis protein MoaE [Candidatus Rokubacteria bacterium]
MIVRVLAFASAREALGAGELEVELGSGSLAELRAKLEAGRPALAALWPRLAIAVDGEVVQGEPTLAEGAEVALLPPVSGGAAGESPSTLVDGPIDVASVLARVADPSRGATVIFLGTVRDRRAEREVVGLTYEAYRPMALAVLDRLVAEVGAAHPGARLAVEHRIGEVGAGEVTVAIAVASPHRSAAYSASRELLERLKREAPIWKRERYADGSAAWREEEPLGGRELTQGTADWPILEP